MTNNGVVIEPLVITVEDAMRLSTFGRTYTYRLINDGSIASIKRGKRRLIVYASLKNFLTATTQTESGWSSSCSNIA